MTMAGDNSGAGGAAKKQRIDTDNRISSSTVAITDSSSPQNETLTHESTTVCRFNDAATADVILRLHFDDQSSPSDRSTGSNSAVDQSEVQVYLHSSVLRRSKYFDALLSDRWRQTGQDDESPENSVKMHRLNLAVPASAGSFDHHLKVLEMLYSKFPFRFGSVASAISSLPIALELLFEDCVRECVRFLETVPWSEDEEKRIMDLIPLLNRDEEAKGLVDRVSVPASRLSIIGASAEMLLGLIDSALHGQPKVAFAKAFVAKLLRDFASKRDTFAVLNVVFESILHLMKRCLEDYSSPDFRGNHINEIEGIQKLHLHNAMTHGKNLLWLVERMVELGVADSAVLAWSSQVGFTINLQRAFGDDLWINVAPSLPAVVLRCTSRLASYIVSGDMSAPKQMRSGFVRHWLPVLITCKDRTSPMGPDHKSLYLELEETFLKIISTLSMCESRNLLTECLSFSTRNIDDCPHLVAAFATWFRRTNGPSQPDPSH